MRVYSPEVVLFVFAFSAVALILFVRLLRYWELKDRKRR